MKTVITLVLLSFCYVHYGQCPISIVSSSTQPAACPSGGSISLIASGTGVTYRITNGPSGFSTASNSTGNFTSLTAGTYTIEASNGFCNISSNFVVTSTYANFSVSAVTSSNVCTSGNAGGTIQATIIGGRAPYRYDIVPSNGTPVYGVNTTSTTYSETVTSFGVYRVYVRDACGEVRTFEIDLQPLQPRPVDFWWIELIRNRPCTETMDGLPTVTLNTHLVDVDGTGINFYDLIGSTFQIYKPNPANSINWNSANSSCTVTQGALLSSGTIVASNIPATDHYAYPITIPQQDVIIMITTACGETFKYCYNFNEGNPYTPQAVYDVIQESCNNVWVQQSIYLKPRYVYNMTEPITYRLTKNGGGIETNTDGYFWNLRMVDLPATVRLTDACGRVLNLNIARPVQGTALQSEIEPQWQFYCSNVRNTATAYVRVLGGDLQGIEEATNVVITGGTPTAIPRVSSYQNWIPGYYASNLLAGFTYKIVITNLCNEKDSILFTVPLDHWGQPTLNWNLTAIPNPLCGQNKGTITANSNFSGNEFVQYYLYNQSAPNTVIATNTTGLFIDVPSGNYKVKFNVPNSSVDCPSNAITDSINVTLLSAGVDQTIVSKTVNFCESAGGTVLSTGKAMIEVNGAAPFTYEIIRTNLIGTGASEVWTVSSSNNTNNFFVWDLPLAGDPSNTQYTLRSTDKCGNKITTQASLQPINNPTIEAGVQPCIGTMNYTFGVKRYGSAFSYRWVKFPDLVTTISTQNTVTFPGAYSNLNDGYYKCYINLPGCVSREIDVFITSALCFNLLPVKIVNFNANLRNDYSNLQWTVENQDNLTQFEIERSFNGIDFTTVGSIAKRTNSNVYDYKDWVAGLSSNIFYYRLKIKTNNAQFTYSNIIKLSSSQTGTIGMYPNPVKDITTLNVNANMASKTFIHVMDQSGRVVYQKRINLLSGTNIITINDLQSLQKGVYVLELLVDEKENRRIKFIKE